MYIYFSVRRIKNVKRKYFRCDKSVYLFVQQNVLIIDLKFEMLDKHKCMKISKTILEMQHQKQMMTFLQNMITII